MSIVVLGSVNLDIVVKSHRMPRTGETLTGDSVSLFPGGKGANQAVAAARLAGDEVIFLGRVGTDHYGLMLREALVDARVNTEHLRASDGASGVASIIVDDAGNNSIVVVPGANGTVDSAFVDAHRSIIQKADILLLQLEIPIDSIEFAVRIAAASGTQVILDPAPATPLNGKVVEGLSWLTPNFGEACLLTGREVGEVDPRSPRVLLDDLQELGAKNILLKLGDAGLAVALNSGERFHIPSHSVDVMDTTAAGDALNGAFAVALAEGMSVMDAASFANAAAAISVTRRGAQPSMPTRVEVNEFLGAASEKGSLRA
jgi:ribokinase